MAQTTMRRHGAHAKPEGGAVLGNDATIHRAIVVTDRPDTAEPAAGTFRAVPSRRDQALGKPPSVRT